MLGLPGRSQSSLWAFGQMSRLPLHHRSRLMTNTVDNLWHRDFICNRLEVGSLFSDDVDFILVSQASLPSWQKEAQKEGIRGH